MNLIEDINSEIDRCIKLIDTYKAIGPIGSFGTTMISLDIAAGRKAIESGDTVAMVRALARLKACQ